MLTAIDVWCNIGHRHSSIFIEGCRVPHPLALNVDDLEASVAFYSSLLDTTPAKRKPGYATFAVDEPPLKPAAAGCCCCG